MWTRDRVTLLDLSVLVPVQDHVHLGQSPSGDVLFLPVDRDAAGCLSSHLQQQRPGAAGRVVHGLVLAGCPAYADHLGQDPGDLGWRVELSLALTRLSGEVAHEVLVGIAKEVITFGSGTAEVQVVEDRDQLGQAILHLLALTEFLLVVEVS